MNRKLLIAAALIGAALPPAAAVAAAVPAGVAAGMQVVDKNGGAVATVTRIDGDYLIVKTDKHEARLPAASFTPYQGKLLFAMTQAELDAQIENTLATANAALTKGAYVRGSGGQLAGTIDAIDDQYVTLKLVSGELVRLPRASVGPGPGGAIISIPVDQLKSMAAAAPAVPAPAQPPATPQPQ